MHRRRTHALVMIAILAGMVCLGYAEDRIDLSVGNFRPLDAETAKFLTPIKRTALDSGKTDLSAEDRQFLSPEELGNIRKLEILQKIRETQEAREEVKKQNDQRELEIEKLRDAMLGQPEMRPVFEAAKKLSARLSQFDIFRILERNDMAELLQEARSESATQSGDVFASARLMAGYQVLVDVGDLKTSSSEGSVGGVNFRDTEYRRDFIVKLQNMADGSMAMGDTITIKKKQTVTDVGGQINDEVHLEMIDEAVEKIAEAIYGNFIASIKFEFKPAGKITDFDPSLITVSLIKPDTKEEIDTASHEEEKSLRKGKYILLSGNSDYLFAGGKAESGTLDFSKSKTQSIAFELANQEVDFVFNDPDGNFPSITLTPDGWEGDVVSIASSGPSLVRKGKYKMSAILDGYKDVSDKVVSISASTKTMPIQMTKIPASPVAE